MKINNLKYILLLVLPLLVFSCRKDINGELLSKGEGLLNLQFDYNPGVSVSTKADAVDTVFTVDIIDFYKNVKIKSAEIHTDDSFTADPIKLRAGKYIVVASHGTDNDAAFESPYYEGRDTVDIVVGQTSTASIECVLANVKNSVAFTSALISNFSRYDVTVTNGLSSLQYTGKYKDSCGYFKANDSLAWTIYLTNTDGAQFEVHGNISNVKPREYYRILFDINGNSSVDQGGASLRVVYDSSTNLKEYPIDISLNKDPQPVITQSTGEEIPALLRAPQGAGVIGEFTIHSEAGIKDIKLVHSNSAMTAAGLPADNSLISNPTSLSAAGITWDVFTEGMKDFTVDMRNFFKSKLGLGDYTFTIAVLDMQSQYVSATVTVKVIPDVEISIINVDTWGGYAIVNAQYNTETAPEGMGFRYKKTSDSEWTTYTGALNTDGIKYSATITGLQPYTQYEFQAVSTKDVKEDNIVKGTPCGTNQLPFSSFDSWIQIDGAYFPTDNINNLFWDSANKATGSMGTNPTTQDSAFKISGSAARLESCSMLGVLAAGNLYTGYFVARNGTNASVSFGRPYKDRPRKLKGYYNYAPKNIDKVKDPYTSLKGQSDYCQIYVMLTNWTEPWIVDSGQKNFIDPKADYVIAYGELSDNKTTGSAFKEFSIELNYLKKNVEPTYIVVVACASKYGDYFTGAIGSVLWVDEFSLEF